MNIYILGTFKYPYGEASSTRMTMLAKALTHGGAKVWIVTCGNNLTQKGEIGSGEREGISYFLLDGLIPSIGSRIFDAILRYTRCRYLLRDWLDTRAPARPDMVIIYGSSGWLASTFLGWGKNRSVPIVFDIVEWYAPFQCLGGRLGPFYYDSEWFIRHVSKKASGLLVISRYLENYYQNTGLPLLRLPGLVDVEATPLQSMAVETNRPFIVLYSGTPGGGKDLLRPLLDAAKILWDRKENVQFVFTGLNLRKSMYAQGYTPSDLDCLGNVLIHGWLEEDDLINVRRSADAMVVFRAPDRSSLANFPQKLAEYMAASRPVLVNNIGDLPYYVEDGVEGLVFDNLSGENIAKGILYLIGLPDRGRSLGLAARKMAIDSFDFQTVSQPLMGFLRNIKCSR